MKWTAQNDKITLQDSRIVPVEMVSACVKDAKYNFLKLYLYLNMNYSGKVRRDKIDYEGIQNTLNVKSKKTITATLKKLVNARWLGFNPASGYYFIRGMDTIRLNNQMSLKSAAIFKRENFRSFKSWCGAVLYSYTYKILKRGKHDKFAYKNGKAKQTYHASSRFIKISVNYIALKYSISPAKASKLKKSAASAGYLVVRKNYEATNIKTNELKYFRKNIDSDIINRYLIRQWEVVKQEIDLILPQIPMSKRKKLKTL